MLRTITSFLLALSFHLNAFSLEPSKSYSAVGVEEYNLQNGYKVLFRQSSIEPGDVLIRIFSPGGYAQESTLKEKASAYISFKALLESGLGHTNKTNPVSKMLYQNSAELCLYVLPSSKGFEARIPAKHFENMIAYISEGLKNPVITQSGYERAVAEVNKKVHHLSLKNKYNVLRNTYRAYFDDNHFSPVSPGDIIQYSDKETAQQFITKAFEETEPMTIVIVGDIDIGAAIAALNKHLPPRRVNLDHTTNQLEPLTIDSPKSFQLPASGDKDPVTYITYGVKLDPTENSLAVFETMLGVIENRLDEQLSAMVGMKGFRVAFEFPLYPDVSFCWIQIKFYAQQSKRKETILAIEHQLEDLISNGPSLQEVTKVASSLERDGYIQTHDNYFWLSLVSDYAIYDWDINKIAMRLHQKSETTPSDLQLFMKRSIAFDAPITTTVD